jgi:hypothetical protein
MQTESRNLVPVTKWNSKYEYPSIGQLRWMIFNGPLTGFDDCVVRIGRRVFIDEDRYWNWVNNKNPKMA